MFKSSRFIGREMQGDKGFTLVEVVVTILIVGILMGLLFPAVQYVRESARRSTCMSNLRQQGLAAINHESANRQLPRLYNGMSSSTPKDVFEEFYFFSWRAAILPYADQIQKYRELDFNRWPTDQQNLLAISATIPWFLCPSASCTNEKVVEHPTLDSTRLVGPLGRNDYEIVVGARPRRLLAGEHYLDYSTVEWGCWGRIEYDLTSGAVRSYQPGRLKEITDGLSQTILLGERAGRPDEYVRGKRTHSYTGYDPTSVHQSSFNGSAWALSNHSAWNLLIPDQELNVVNYSGFYGFHTGGVNIAKVDGSTHTLSATTEGKVVRAMVSMASGDRSGDDSQ